jgi:hypothetical protein
MRRPPSSRLRQPRRAELIRTEPGRLSANADRPNT